MIQLRFLACSLIITGMCAVILPVTTRASLSAGDIDVILAPEVPAPNADVAMTLSSYATDLDSATISWAINGRTVLSGIGKKTYSMTAPDIGKAAIVDIIVLTTSLDQIKKRVMISPADVDLLVQAPDSYVPPFYEGRSLPASEATIRVVAVPHVGNGVGAETPRGQVIYNWHYNTDAVPDASGYGKDSYTYKNSYLHTNEIIGVVAKTRDSAQTGSANVTISPISPKIVFYTRSPIRNLDLSASIPENGFTLGAVETTFFAAPYFFSTGGSSAGLSYAWTINDKPITTPSTPSMLSLKGGTGAGLARVGLTVEKSGTLFQKITKTLNLTLH